MFAVRPSIDHCFFYGLIQFLQELHHSLINSANCLQNLHIYVICNKFSM